MSKYRVLLCFMLGTISFIKSFAQFNSANCMEIELLVSETSCSDSKACDGEARVLVTNGIGPFYYAWDNGEAGYDIEQIGGLCAGSHKVIVFDIGKLQEVPDLTFPGGVNIVPPCGYEEQTFIISASSEPCGVKDACGNDIVNGTPSICNCPLEVALNMDPSTCVLRKDGIVSVSSRGGVPPYNILWNDGSTSWYRNIYGGVRYTAVVTDYLENSVSIAFDSGTKSGDSECETRVFGELSEILEALIANLIETVGGVITTELIPDDYNTTCPYQLALIAKTPKGVSTDEGEISMNIRLKGNSGYRAEYTWIPDNGQGFDGSRVDLTNGNYMITASLTEVCTNKIDVSLVETCVGATDETISEKIYYRLSNIPQGVIVPIGNDGVLNFVYDEEYEVNQATLNYKIYNNQGNLLMENVTDYYTHFGLNKISLDSQDHNLIPGNNYLLEVISPKNEKTYLRFSY